MFPANPCGRAPSLRRIALGLALAAAAAGCTEIGPTVAVTPGSGRTDTDLAVDRAVCMEQTDARVQPMANRLNLNVARNASDVATDNGRIQRAYDESYAACMSARGDIVTAPTGTSTHVTANVGPASAVAEGVDRHLPPHRLPSVADPVSLSAINFVASELDALRRSCPGEDVAATVRAAAVSTGIEARVVSFIQLHGGACLGNIGEEDRLVIRHGGRWETLLTAPFLEILSSSHRGWSDVVGSGHGNCRITYFWNGAVYVAARTGCA